MWQRLCPVSTVPPICPVTALFKSSIWTLLVPSHLCPLSWPCSDLLPISRICLCLNKFYMKILVYNILHADNDASLIYFFKSNKQQYTWKHIISMFLWFPKFIKLFNPLSCPTLHFPLKYMSILWDTWNHSYLTACSFIWLSIYIFVQFIELPNSIKNILCTDIVKLIFNALYYQKNTKILEKHLGIDTNIFRRW